MENLWSPIFWVHKGHSPHSKMPQINISSAGVSKLLCNLNPHKPDNIHGRVLKELNEQVLFKISAFSTVYVTRIPSRYRGATPELSVHMLLI
jgi:hypothetical protein